MGLGPLGDGGDGLDQRLAGGGEAVDDAGWDLGEGLAGDEAVALELGRLLADGWVRAEPVVYEDFLPASAAGIFASNLDAPEEGGAAGGDAPAADGQGY